MSREWTFGSDPELLVVNGDQPKSAIGVVPGSPVSRINVNGNEFYYDNVLAECAIKPGATRAEVLANFAEALRTYATMVRPYRLVPQASAVFPDAELQHEAAKIAGCAVDWCAYEVREKDPPKEAIQTGNLRSCGGHVHLGSETLAGNGPEPIFAVYLLDLFLGVPSLWLDRDPTSARRRALYGHAGRYRTKDYGIEYRSLGNFWLATPELTGFVYDVCGFVQDFVESGRVHELWSFDLDTFYGDDIAAAWTCKGYDTGPLRAAINTGRRELAEPHLALAKRLLPDHLRADLDRLVHRPADNFYQSWGLG
jgi:hypothetical protein